MSQKDVAEAVGATRPSISRWEAGGRPPSDAMLTKLAAYFGVTPAWLRYGQEPRVAEQEAAEPDVISGYIAGESFKPVPRKRAARKRRAK